MIHAVGPIWQGGGHGEDDLLASAYRASPRIAEERGLRSIAFPSISTGIYGFPIERAATIVLRAAAEHLARAEAPREVTFALICVRALLTESPGIPVADLNGGYVLAAQFWGPVLSTGVDGMHWEPSEQWWIAKDVHSAGDSPPEHHSPRHGASWSR